MAREVKPRSRGPLATEARELVASHIALGEKGGILVRLAVGDHEWEGDSPLAGSETTQLEGGVHGHDTVVQVGRLRLELSEEGAPPGEGHAGGEHLRGGEIQVQVPRHAGIPNRAGQSKLVDPDLPAGRQLILVQHAQ